MCVIINSYMLRIYKSMQTLLPSALCILPDWTIVHTKLLKPLCNVDDDGNFDEDDNDADLL